MAGGVFVGESRRLSAFARSGRANQDCSNSTTEVRDRLKTSGIFQNSIFSLLFKRFFNEF